MISCSCSANPISKSLGQQRTEGRTGSGEGLPLQPVPNLSQPRPHHTASHVRWCLPHVSLTQLPSSPFDIIILSNNNLEILGLICSVSYRFILKSMTTAPALSGTILSTVQISAPEGSQHPGRHTLSYPHSAVEVPQVPKTLCDLPKFTELGLMIPPELSTLCCFF